MHIQGKRHATIQMDICYDEQSTHHLS